jgi:peroxiredoxin
MGYSLLKAPRSAQRHLDQKYLSFELASDTAQHATKAFGIST